MKLKKYWQAFRDWKPRIIEMALTFIVIGFLAGIANEENWFFPVMWVEGNGVNYLDLLSILAPQLMMLKRVSHKNYDPS